LRAISWSNEGLPRGGKRPKQPASAGTKKVEVLMATKKGLYANIHAKRERIKAGSGESMRKPGSKGHPENSAFTKSAKTAKKPKKRG
jgi:hypothetical protein